MDRQGLDVLVLQALKGHGGATGLPVLGGTFQSQALFHCLCLCRFLWTIVPPTMVLACNCQGYGRSLGPWARLADCCRPFLVSCMHSVLSL